MSDVYTITIEADTVKQIVSLFINFGVGFMVWLFLAMLFEDIDNKKQFALLILAGSLLVSATAWVTFGGQLNIIAGIAGWLVFFAGGELSDWYNWCKSRVVYFYRRFCGSNDV